MTNHTPPPDWKDSVSADTQTISRKGYVATGLTLGAFMVWAVSFPLASAVIATGKVTSAGQNKLLQHPSGGVVRMIAAEEGSILKSGDIVAKIEPSAAVAELTSLSAMRNLLLAKKSRLLAEKNGLETFSDPNSGSLELSGLRGTQSAAGIDQETGKLVYEEQEAEFIAGMQRHKSELSVLKNQLTTLEGEYLNKRKQLEQEKARLELLNKQYQGMVPLVEEGHIAKIRLWDVESNRLQLKVQVAQFEGELESTIGRMDEIEDQISVINATREQENSKELTDVLSELASIEDRINAARKLVEYSDIKAPVSGTLTNVTVHTIGGVVQPGDVIAEIVPADNPLQVEARIMPADIASVAPQQDAEIVITAFNRYLDDPIPGKISYVAADSQLDELTGEPYFLVRITLAAEKSVASRLKAGMFTEVYIQTEARSFMSYLLRPVTDSYRKAFRET
ncbi:MAG: HlyD family type I secretion periplasmic adaptor subunit [Pseudomonadota bacterium]